MAYVVYNSFWIVMQDGPLYGYRLLVEIRTPIDTYTLIDQTEVQYASGPAYGVIPAFGEHEDMLVYLEPQNEFFTIAVPEAERDIRAWRIV